MRWTEDRPRLNGEWYWHRPKGVINREAIPVKVDFTNTIFLMGKEEWSHCPIPFPEEKEIKNVKNFFGENDTTNVRDNYY